MGIIAEMVKEFGFTQEEYGQLPKFSTSLTNEVTTLENIKNIVEYLRINGIVIKPRDLSVCANNFETVKARVDEAKALGEIQAYIDNPKLINKKGFLDRIKYCQINNAQYKTPEGKYLSVVVSDMEFKKIYGNVLVKEKEPISIEETVLFPVEENLITQENISTGVLDNDLTGSKEVTQNFNLNPIEQVLTSPKEDSITDEQLVRFEELYTSLGHIMVNVFGTEEVNETIANNLRKLVSSNIEDNREILYSSITFGKQVDQMQKEYLYSAIDSELALYKQADSNIELGRSA